MPAALARDIDLVPGAHPRATVVDMFVGMVRINPAAPAIWSPAAVLTRACVVQCSVVPCMLPSQANVHGIACRQFAARVFGAARGLRACGKGVGPGTRVALLIHEDVAMATMLMAILAAGYVQPSAP
jgi:acyl-CoA synthetase (AMP-forming)/AMP-acid ligase II